MTKNMYIQPSVNITEMEMVQALCVVSGGSGTPLSTIDPEAKTDIQL